MEALKVSTDTLFILLGAIMVLAMHSGFAFLELGTVRKKSQVNALVKILSDFSISTIAYFFVGYGIAYGVNFMGGAEQLAAHRRHGGRHLDLGVVLVQIVEVLGVGLARALLSLHQVHDVEIGRAHV